MDIRLQGALKPCFSMSFSEVALSMFSKNCLGDITMSDCLLYLDLVDTELAVAQVRYHDRRKSCIVVFFSCDRRRYTTSLSTYPDM